jgi:hypothetical protein
MSFDAEQHVHYRVANAPIRTHPFPHFYVDDVFPAAFYSELRQRLPGQNGYTRIDETGSVAKGAYPERFVCSLAELEEGEANAGGGTAFWADFSSWLLGDAFAALILGRFRPFFPDRFGENVEPRIELDARLVRDVTNYAISPHTDSPRKLVSLLFYLPADDSMRHLGTSLYAPKDPAFRCPGTGHHPFENFKKIATMEYRPNTLLAFFKTDRAFHGVDRITDTNVVRDLLLYNIYVTKLVGRQPAPAAGRGWRWPWQRA